MHELSKANLPKHLHLDSVKRSTATMPQPRRATRMSCLVALIAPFLVLIGPMSVAGAQAQHSTKFGCSGAEDDPGSVVTTTGKRLSSSEALNLVGGYGFSLSGDTQYWMSFEAGVELDLPAIIRNNPARVEATFDPPASPSALASAWVEVLRAPEPKLNARLSLEVEGAGRAVGLAKSFTIDQGFTTDPPESHLTGTIEPIGAGIAYVTPTIRATFEAGGVTAIAGGMAGTVYRITFVCRADPIVIVTSSPGYPTLEPDYFEANYDQVANPELQISHLDPPLKLDVLKNDSGYDPPTKPSQLGIVGAEDIRAEITNQQLEVADISPFVSDKRADCTSGPVGHEVARRVDGGVGDKYSTNFTCTTMFFYQACNDVGCARSVATLVVHLASAWERVVYPTRCYRYPYPPILLDLSTSSTSVSDEEYGNICSGQTVTGAHLAPLLPAFAIIAEPFYVR